MRQHSRPPRVRAPRSRNGFTLIELLAVLSCMAALMASYTGLLILFMNKSTDSATQAMHWLTLDRLEDYFRLDVAQSAPFEGTSSARQDLTLQQHDGTEINYSQQNGILKRTLRRPDGIQGIEVFPLPAGEWTFQPQGSLVRLIYSPAAPETTADHNQVPVEIVANMKTSRARAAVEEVAP